MTKLDLIDTTIQPDPFKPQAGDVYEFGHPFTQRLVVEDAPSVGDFRVRFRIDGGDSSLTSVRAFHLLLAGFRGLRGIGRVVEMTAAASQTLLLVVDGVTLPPIVFTDQEQTAAECIARINLAIDSTEARLAAEVVSNGFRKAWHADKGLLPG